MLLKTLSYFSQYEVLLVKWQVTNRFCIDCTGRGVVMDAFASWLFW